MKKKPYLKYSGVHARNKVFLEDEFLEKEVLAGYTIDSQRAFYEEIGYITLHKRIFWEVLFFLCFAVIFIIIAFVSEGVWQFIPAGIATLIGAYVIYRAFIRKLEIMFICSNKYTIRVILKVNRKKRSIFIHDLLEKIEKAQNLTREKKYDQI
ncbi:MAG: hypothetical protein KAI43_02485 [Candidatus Aureabacteria bacterium]|nr:hypothetical protein [Candidatus Auribacterota bacterium]